MRKQASATQDDQKPKSGFGGAPFEERRAKNPEQHQQPEVGFGGTPFNARPENQDAPPQTDAGDPVK